METRYAGKGTQLGTFFIGVIAASIGLMSVFSDWRNAQMPPSPEALIEAEPPAAIPSVANSSTPPAVTPAPSPSAIAQSQIDELVQAWRNAWTKRDADTYLAFYADDFQGSAPTPQQWRASRKRIIGQAQRIDIQIGQTEITLKDADSASIAFPLDYISDRFEDHGTKVLEVRHKEGRWLIEGESFTAN